MSGETLGDRLRTRRKELGLTLADVAARADLSLPYISNLERDRGNPTLDALKAIAGALDTTVAELTSGAPPDDTPDALPMPKSLRAFVKTADFEQQVRSLAARQSVSPDEMRDRLVVAMRSAPRRSAGEPSEQDWRRLLDVYRLILDEPN